MGVLFYIFFSPKSQTRYSTDRQYYKPMTVFLSKLTDTIEHRPADWYYKSWVYLFLSKLTDTIEQRPADTTSLGCTFFSPNSQTR